MNKMVKKGFSMIELLFVMVILAALTAIAIPSMSSGTESAALTSMKSDMNNIITLLQSKYVDKQDYALVVPTNFENKVANDKTGLYVSGDLKIPITRGNAVSIYSTGGIGSCTAAGQGFSIVISNPNVPKFVTFNSCTDGKIIMQDINSGN